MSKHEFPRLHQRLKDKSENPGARTVIYVAIGDSVTQGCLGPNEIEHEQVYHELLRRRVEKHYPEANFNVINSGVGGDTAEQSRTRWERDVLLYKPDLVTICFGLNDCHRGEAGIETYITAIGDLINRIRMETEAEILILSTIMMLKKDNPNVPDLYQAMVPDFIHLYEEGTLLKYNHALRSYAADHAIPLLDVYAIWEQMDQEGVDIHTRLSNGINHPDIAFHHQLSAQLEARLLE
ncbi:SGNH/GDSL hydrolase family protein [Paenibacillus luteus]|uniref:SGNH/GDSL hydrolase family protein n=1 Tax=Paenibacillus luteus TaxID=2545753 RepID=UPI001375AE74|nr:SGNH/GDSL hydrolase family protein [Paenibacillus luteus]